MWGKELSNILANIILKHHERSCVLAGTATTAWLNDYQATYPGTRAKWVPGPIAELYKLMHEQHGNKDDKATKVPAIAKGARKTPLDGPCLFGHTFTTLRNHGKPQWLPNPDPPLWDGTPIGAALCQKCYIHGRTLAARKRRELPEVPIAEPMSCELPSSSKRRRCFETEAKGAAFRAPKAQPLFPPTAEPESTCNRNPSSSHRQLTISTARPPGHVTTSRTTTDSTTS